MNEEFDDRMRCLQEIHEIAGILHVLSILEESQEKKNIFDSMRDTIEEIRIEVRKSLIPLFTASKEET